MRNPIILGCFLGLFLVWGSAQAGGPKLTYKIESGSIPAGGLERNYLYYVPSNLKTAKRPLVFVLHGGGGEAKGMVRMTYGRFNELADREGFLVVYPNGVDHHWNDGRDLNDKTHQKNTNDVGFITALIERFEDNYGADPQRIYVTGISNGGFMSCRLACELSDKIAAAAPVAASLSKALSKTCDPAFPISMMFINGDADPLVPYAGGDVQVLGLKRGAILSVRDAALFWAMRGGCTLPAPQVAMPDKDPEDETTLLKTAYSNPKTGLDVILYTLHGGGHTWPKGWPYLGERIVGRVSQELDATDVIWEFFKAHPKP